MHTLRATAPSFQSACRSRRAFSLVEIVMALAIIAFAFLSVLGMIPLGLTTFHRAMDASIGSQIGQRVINDAQQTDFDVLITSGTQTGKFVVQAPRLFDDQGTELASTGTDMAKAIYWVNTRIAKETTTPVLAASAAISGTSSGNANLATVTVQVANNPTGFSPTSDGVTQLWNQSRFPTTTYSAIIARNK